MPGAQTHKVPTKWQGLCPQTVPGSSQESFPVLFLSQTDPLGGHGADIFAGTATAAERRIDCDPLTNDKLDRVGLTALQASEAAATAGQTVVIASDRYQVIPVSRDEYLLLIRIRLNHRRWF